MYTDVTGLVLAGGRASRMGGLDKGLQLLKNRPLVAWVLHHLQAQVQALLINANRSEDAYSRFGIPICSDPALTSGETETAYAGPLAGMLAGLKACQTPWLITAPCDTPVIPPDYVDRLYRAAQAAGSRVAMVRAPEVDPYHPCTPGPLRRQPVFCLLHCDLANDLARYLAVGERKIDRWTDLHHPIMVDFDGPTLPAFAFANVNTLQELAALEQHL